MKKATLCILTLFVLLISACTGPMSGTGGDGSIVIRLGTAGGRAVYDWPPTDAMLEKINYVITLTGSAAQTLTAKHGDTIRAAVTPGSWKIAGQAYLDGELYAEASVTVDIKPGQNEVILNMKRTGSDNIHSICGTDPCSCIVITTTAEWDTAIAAINAGGSGKDYTLVINGSFAVPMVNGWSTANFGSLTNISVTLKGSGTISLSSNGLMFYIKLNQTLIIDGPALQGRNNNSDSLIEIDGGKLELRSGSITGNTIITTGYCGGGVYVNNSGTFTMTGGTVRGNSAPTQGGGVYVTSGEFTMTGGTISDNKSNTDDGGGVYVYDGDFTMSGSAIISGNITSGGGGGVYVTGTTGKFTMSDNSTISGNTADMDGGGVYLASGGTFTMTGGTIGGNKVTSASGGGGGVYITSTTGNTSTFTMSGGTISSNKASDGGGVYVGGGNGGTFTMSGGTISGNTATNTFSYGGGVCILNGTFTKSGGGTIYGNDINTTVNNTASKGHAVYLSASPAKYRDTTAGTGDTVNTTTDTDTQGNGFWQ